MESENSEEVRKRRRAEEFEARYEAGLQRARERRQKQKQEAAEVRPQPNPQTEPNVHDNESLFVPETTSTHANVTEADNTGHEFTISMPKLDTSGGSKAEINYGGIARTAQEPESIPDVGDVDGTPMSISSDEYEPLAKKRSTSNPSKVPIPETQTGQGDKLNAPQHITTTTSSALPGVMSPLEQDVTIGGSSGSYPVGRRIPEGQRAPKSALRALGQLPDETRPSATSQDTSESILKNMRQPPVWQSNKFRAPEWISNPGTSLSAKPDRNLLARLSKLRTLMLELEKLPMKTPMSQDEIEKVGRIRDELHDYEYRQPGRLTVKHSQLLSERNGLVRLFDGPLWNRVSADVSIDAKGLWLRWEREEFDPDILRGLEVKKGAGGRTTNELKKDAPRLKANFFGEEGRGFVNGSWWPLLKCALRDGCHGAPQAGIYGDLTEGAYSILVSHSPYADRDEGDSLDYCGTHFEDETETKIYDGRVMTKSTAILMVSARTQKPVRVIRSSKLPPSNPYRPECGIRYDGVYIVVGWTVLDENKGVYRFALRRVDGQGPIRYQGPGKRPTAKDVEAFQQHEKRFKGEL
ncbi:MAG: hypothetical protein M1831_001742 [Alyxoria varia]|nr:MAG: hypothetical protein M1831_001742 [Alyxoria varia]